MSERATGVAGRIWGRKVETGDEPRNYIAGVRLPAAPGADEVRETYVGSIGGFKLVDPVEAEDDGDDALAIR
jgi:hypothetical protein